VTTAKAQEAPSSPTATLVPEQAAEEQSGLLHENQVALSAPPLPELRQRDLQTAVAAALGGVECGHVKATLTQATADGQRLILTGHIASPDEAAGLGRKLSGMPGVAAVDQSGLVVLPRPICSIPDRLIQAGARLSSDQRIMLDTVGMPGEMGTLHLHGGSELRLLLTAPDFDAWVYVDYYDRDGRVLHLLPSPAARDNRFVARSRLQLGASNGVGRVMRIAPPFGRDLVVGVATPRPIFRELRPEIERAEDYLTALTHALTSVRRDAPGSPIELFYLVIDTMA
jgi:hypothetical protein